MAQTGQVTITLSGEATALFDAIGAAAKAHDALGKALADVAEALSKLPTVSEAQARERLAALISGELGPHAAGAGAVGRF